MRRIAVALLGIAVGAAVLGAAVVFLGEFHRLSAIRQHPTWVYWGLDRWRDLAVAVDARGVEVPADFAPGPTPGGVVLYARHCAQCHGAPGVAPAPFALGMMPSPPNLSGAAQERPPREVYWFIRNGLKMSGMPAWHLRLTEEEMWQVTATVAALPRISPAEWRALLQASQSADPVARLADGKPDPERGRLALRLYGCRTCHMIPGLVGRFDVRVGPPLDELGSRAYVAGVLANEPEAVVHWIMDPQSVDPLSAMPDLGVSEDVARDVAAYLYTVASDPRDDCAPHPSSLDDTNDDGENARCIVGAGIETSAP